MTCRKKYENTEEVKLIQCEDLGGNLTGAGRTKRPLCLVLSMSSDSQGKGHSGQRGRQGPRHSSGNGKVRLGLQLARA